MSSSHKIDAVSTDRLLNCLGLAIDEAKLVRSIIESKDRAYQLKKDNPFSDRLIFINREITYLEKKLAQVRSLAEKDGVPPQNKD